MRAPRDTAPSDPHPAAGIDARKRAAGLSTERPEAEPEPEHLGLLPATRARTGRPPSYSPELAATILEQIAGGETLTAICRKPGMPSVTTVGRWIVGEGEAFDVFRAAYRRARAELADRLADQIIEIADSANDVDTASSARVQVAARQWYASKLKPGVYGDNVNVNVGASEGGIVINLGRFVGSPPSGVAPAIEGDAKEVADE